MPEKDLRALQGLISETASELPLKEESRYRRECLGEADRLIDEVIRDLESDADRDTVRQKVYRIMILAGEGGAYGPKE